jgi:hypothetical protein
MSTNSAISAPVKKGDLIRVVGSGFVSLFRVDEVSGNGRQLSGKFVVPMPVFAEWRDDPSGGGEWEVSSRPDDVPF